MIRFPTQAATNNEHFLNRSVLEGRTTSNIQKPRPIFQTSLSITLSKVERNRLGRSQPLITSMAMKSLQRPCTIKGIGDVFDRKAIDVKLIVAEKCSVKIASIRLRAPFH